MLLVCKHPDILTKNAVIPFRDSFSSRKNSENRKQYKTNWFGFIAEVHPVLRIPKNQENNFFSFIIIFEK